MSGDPVFCVDCAEVEPHSRKGQTWGWLCMEFRRRPKGAISLEVLDVDPPYERCVDVNRYNNCNCFRQRAQNAHDTGPN